MSTVNGLTIQAVANNTPNAELSLYVRKEITNELTIIIRVGHKYLHDEMWFHVDVKQLTDLMTKETDQ